VNAIFLALIIGAFYVSTRRTSKGAWREQAERDIRARLGEETPQELRELEAAERETQESNAAAGAFWAEEMLFADYEGGAGEK